MRVVATLLNIIATYNELFWLYQWVNIFFIKKEYIKKSVKQDKIIDQVICWIYVFLVIGLNQIEPISAYTMIFLMISNVALVRLLWRSDLVQSLAVVGGYFFTIFMIGNVEISLTGIIGGEKLIQQTTVEQGLHRIIYILIWCVLWYFINKCGTKFIRKKVVAPQRMRYWAGVSIVGFGGSAFIGTMLVDSFSIQVGTIWYIFLVIILVIIFVGYFVMKQKEAQLRMTILNSKNEMLEKNYIQVNEFYATNAKLYHDMNHHLNALYHMLQNGEEREAKKYIESLRHTNNYNQIRHQTGINVLDAVLYEMEKRAEKQGVAFMTEISVLPCDLGIESSDICSLFANLLENALEAATKEVIIKVKKVNQALIIVIQNDYVVEPIRRGNYFVTQKQEKNMHGWGTQIVEEIVQKYEGSIAYEMENGYFVVNIMLNEKQ